MNATARIDSLDGLRGIAAVGVMIFHFNYFFVPQAQLSELLPFLRPMLVHAYLCVDLFFLLSGFVMAHVYGQELALDWRAHWKNFALLRFARIYPLFALTTGVMVVAHAWAQLPLSGVSFSARSLMLQPFLLQQWSDLSWDYPSWSIGAEVVAYAFFVFAAGMLIEGRYPRVVAGACVATLVVLFIGHGDWLNLYRGAPAVLRGISEFSLGVLLYRAHRAAGDSSGFPPALLALGCVVFAALTRWDIATVGVFASLVYYGAKPDTFLARLLDSRPAVALGAWSYSIYLWHAPAHYAVMAMFSALGHPVQTLDVTEARLLIAATALGVICLSALTFHFFEVPARRLIRRTLLHPKPSMEPSRIACAANDLVTACRCRLTALGPVSAVIDPLHAGRTRTVG